ncbi:Memo-like protein [uncultured archaeon]|nr:Memo-like protein [uncultured archaeon]
MFLKICRDLGEAVAKAVKETGLRVTVVASSDMTHAGAMYNQMPPSGMSADEFARNQDKYALKEILALSPEKLFNAVSEYDISMCGFGAVAAALYAAKALGAKKSELVDYRTSAESTGDINQVVGYGGVLIT